jgi:hypothetical protein
LKKRFENCAIRLPDKRNLDHIELFSKDVILEMEDKLPLMSNQVDSSVEELKKEDNKIVMDEEEIQCLGNVLKLTASFKDAPKIKARNYVLKNPENKKNQVSKQIWVVKGHDVEEKEVEEVSPIILKNLYLILKNVV